MKTTSSGDPAIFTEPTNWASLRGHAPGLEDIAGRLRLQVAGVDAGVLKVESGAVEILPEGDASALMAVDSQATLLSVLSGDTHPFVAFLQGRLRLEGDRALALRIGFGLRAGSPWSGLTPGS